MVGTGTDPCLVIQQQSAGPELPFMHGLEVQAIDYCLALFRAPVFALEWGSGNSTLYFASKLPKGSSWCAIEHNREWAEKVAKQLEESRRSDISLTYIPPQGGWCEGQGDGDRFTFGNYIDFPATLHRNFQIIFVDGRARVDCMRAAWPLLDENGVMILHDAQRQAYDPGVPADCFAVRVTNSREFLEGRPLSVLFMSKSIALISQLARGLTALLPEFMLVAYDDTAGLVGAEKLQWADLAGRSAIRLYAGDIPAGVAGYDGLIGLSITKSDARHILHDITALPFPLPDNSVDSFQAEDVFEHIPYEKLAALVDEIFRVLKPGGTFRLSVPDYGCDVLRERSVKDAAGRLVFDPGGGGTPVAPGHLWFPRLANVEALLEQTVFARLGRIEYLQYWQRDEATFVVQPIDYTKGYVQRTPDHDLRVQHPYRPLSLVVDLVKGGIQAREDNHTELPVHFFTIVLNGEPFIRHHLETFTQLPFNWHWHVIEGVAEHKHDTAWTLAYGGRITDSLHTNGLSNDGTTAYLDEIAAAYPQQVTVYRKPGGMLWDGKLEMVLAPLKNITQESLLWQVDVDEFWSAEQLITTRRLFLEQPERTAAFYWCYFFVGPDKVVSTRNCYSQNPAYEWLRTWRFRPGMRWGAHSPPILLEEDRQGNVRDVGKCNPFLHHETEQAGLVFYHYAYTLETQLRFKEVYYGYTGAVAGWQRLQEAQTFPVKLRDYFAWVSDDTQVDTVQHLAIPCFREFPWLTPPAPRKKSGLIVLVDGIFFQFRNTGIARVWYSLLVQWSLSDFAASIILLDRDGTAPVIPNITTVTIPAFHPLYMEEDRQMLQRCCDAAGADIFISTYYTVPQATPSVFMAHDMIPENTTFFDLNEPMWQLKHYGIAHASAFIAVSRNTALDLVRFHPPAADTLTIAHNGIDTACFYQASPDEIARFRCDYGVEKSYFIYVGDRTGYKNGWLFFAGLSALPSRGDYEVVCIGGNPTLEPEFAALVPNVRIQILALPDAQLRAAYSGAVAFVYPSLYEGFGLPILEAMACDCPVITCQTSSIPEVAGAAALYVEPGRPEQMAAAMQQVQDEAIRRFLVHKGRQQIKKFSWTSMAETVRKVLEDTVARLRP